MRNKVGGISMYVGSDKCDYGKLCVVVGVFKPINNCEAVLCVFRDSVVADNLDETRIILPGEKIGIKDCSLIPISDPDLADEIKREEEERKHDSQILTLLRSK